MQTKEKLITSCQNTS